VTGVGGVSSGSGVGRGLRRPSGVRGDVVVVGASITGLTTAIALARRGIGVQLIDADRSLGRAAADGGRTGADPLGELARRAPRRATPQAGHSHAFLARYRQLLRAEAPDVLPGLRAAGCAELVLADHRPATVPAHARHPSDADLVVVGARRTTFEAVLRRAALRRPEIRLVAGRKATGLLVDHDGPVPHVRGVGFDDGTAIPTRLVIDATGRRTLMPGWLAEQGIEVQDQRVECGIAYFTRFYRRAFGAPDLPLERGFTSGGSFDRYSCLVFPGDAGTFSVTFGVLPEDRALRGLLDPVAFGDAVRAIPALAPWIEPAHAEPISEVRMMAGLANRLRTPTSGGRPTVLGWTPVGDAAATTNPAHSRGCTLGAVHGVGVAEAVADHGEDARDLADACVAVIDREQRPWVADSIEQDAQRLARWRPSGGLATLAAPTSAGRLSNGETYLAAQHDAYVWRRFNRLQQLLERPDDVLADTRVLARVRAVQAVRPPGPRLDGPTRDELVELLAAGAAVA
jgi:flavin-dependent dehydrogenase